MKSIVFTALLILLAITTAGAAPAYGTKMPQENNLHVGLQYHTIFESKLEGVQGEMESDQYHWTMSYGLFDWLAIDLKISLGDVKHTNDAGAVFDYDEPVWGGGYGFRIRLYEEDKVKVVTGFQHISIHPKSIDINGTKHEAILDDWQVSLLVSYALDKATPYLGARWSTVDNVHRINDDDRNRIKSARNERFGLIMGFDWDLSQKIWLNVEGNFLDTQALAVSYNFKF